MSDVVVSDGWRSECPYSSARISSDTSSGDASLWSLGGLGGRGARAAVETAEATEGAEAAEAAEAEAEAAALPGEEAVAS